MKKQMISRKVLGKVGETLLKLTQDIGELMVETAFTPYGKLSIYDIPVPKSSFYTAMDRLEKHGLVSKQKKTYKNVYTITGEGKRILRLLKRPKKRIDGFSTVIIFDIPEAKSRQRTIFRRYLIKNGYTMLQKSVFVSPCEVADEVKQLADELKIKPHVSVLLAKIDCSF